MKYSRMFTLEEYCRTVADSKKSLRYLMWIQPDLRDGMGFTE